VDFVRNEKAKGHKVLVACGAAINRSTAFCVASLKEEEGIGLLDAFLAVKAAHIESLPHPPVWQSLCDYYQEEIPYLEVLTQSRK
jgi:hypothetical protein